jgi:hypothetical protein
MSNKSNPTVATMGIDIGKNSFHVVGLDQRGAIMLRQKWSRRSFAKPKERTYDASRGQLRHVADVADAPSAACLSMAQPAAADFASGLFR